MFYSIRKVIKVQEKYQLTSIDFEMIKQSLTDALSSRKLYDKLYELEIQGQKDSIEFKRITDYLNLVSDLESNSYKNEKKSSNRCAAVINYLNNETLYSSLDSSIDMLLSQWKGKSDKTKIRVLNSFTKSYLNTADGIRKQVPSGLIEVLNYHGISNAEEIVINSYKQGEIITYLLKRDLSHAFNIFLEDAIYNDDSGFIKQELIKVKYDLAYFDVDVEREMIDNKFNVLRVMIPHSSVPDNLLSIDNDTYQYVRNINLSSEAILQLIELLNIKDKKHTDKDITITCILRGSYLRAALSLLDDKYLEAIKEHYYTQISDSEYMRKNKQYKISENMISEIFNTLDKDKKKYICSVVNDEQYIK